MSPQPSTSPYGRCLEEMREALVRHDTAGVLCAAGDLLRRSQALGLGAEAVDDALRALDSAEVARAIDAIDTAGTRVRLERGLEDAFEALLAEDPAERAEWAKEAAGALRERDRLESMRVACERNGGRLQALDAKIAGIDAGLARRAICLVGLNELRREELAHLDPAAREGAWWFAARAHGDVLGEVLAGRKTPDPALASDPADRKALERLAAMKLPPRRVDAGSLWLREIGAASPERARFVERHLDPRDAKALDTDVD